MTEIDNGANHRENQGSIRMSRTLSDVVNTDYFATQMILREHYIYDFKPHEFDNVIEALKWLEVPDNLKVFEKANLHSEEVKSLPDFVRSSRLTLNLFFELGMEVKHHAEEPIFREPVAYDIKTARFRSDLRAVTYKLFEMLKDYDPAKGDPRIDKDNNPEVLLMISKFIESGGTVNRAEATDAISVILFRQYWKILKESAKILSTPGKRLAYF